MTQWMEDLPDSHRQILGDIALASSLVPFELFQYSGRG